MRNMLIVSKSDDLADRIVVLFTLDDKVRVKPIRSLVEWMKKNDVSSGIVFSCNGATTFTMKEIVGYKPEITLEVKCYKKHFFCLVEHEAIPEHKILSDEEKATLLSCIRSKPEDLPQQLVTDPVSQFYGLKPGVVIMYVKRNGSQDMNPYWRIVT
jgi:DNA-directed RNA polymerase I, II, and III subunit RPABC1